MQLGTDHSFFVDTHCHLDSQYFAGGVEQVLERARRAHVRGFVVIGVGEGSSAAREAVSLARLHPRHMTASVGVHPHDAGSVTDALADELAALARDPHVSAIGEIGLDYHYTHSSVEDQKTTFVRFIELAREVKKPVVVHTREAAADTLELLRRESAQDVGGIIHCFSEDYAFAAAAMDLGFDISFSGIVTFKNAAAIQEVARRIPLERVLVETDSPYLAPVPLRGKPCEPAFLVHTATRIAELRGMALEELAAATTQNARKRFGHVFEA